HLVLGQTRVVGDPDGTVLHRVHRVLVRDLVVVDVALAALPVRVVLAADRRALRGADLAVRVLGRLEQGGLLLAVVHNAGDGVRLLLPAQAVLVDLVDAETDDAGGDQAYHREQRDRTPVAALADLDRSDRRAAALVAAAGPTRAGALGEGR